MVRAAAKNHASVAIVTDPARYAGDPRRRSRAGRASRSGLRSALAVEAFRHTAAYDARIAAELPARMAAAGVALPDEPGLPGASDPYPPTLTIGLEKVETLRYGENPHQPAARYRRPGRDRRRRPVRRRASRRSRARRCQLQQRARRVGRRGARALAPRARLRDRQAHEPVRRGRAPDAARGLGGGAGRRSGLGVRRGGGADRRPWTRPLAERADLDLPRGRRRARRSTPARATILAAKPNLRLVVDPTLDGEPGAPAGARARSARARSGPPVAPCSSRLRTPSRTTRRPGPCATSPRTDRRDERARPRPRLAPRPGRHVQRDRPGQGRPAGRARLRPDEPRRRGPPGGGQGAGDLRARTRPSGPPAARTRSSRSRTPSRPVSPPA